MKPARVLIVDDSATMRSLIAASLRADPAIEVVGEAGDPLEARQAIKALNPDVVTLDVEMPNMNGIEFLEKIMRLRPTPVVMVSTLTKRGAEVTLKALEIGAVDCVEKPSPGNERAFGELPAKIKMAAVAKLRARAPELSPASGKPPVTDYQPDGRIVAIGSSTGGVEALITVLSHFPANCPPTVITQHMPPSFTTTFAKRLDRMCAPEVTEARDGARLEPGKVFIAPGGTRHLEIVGGSAPRCRLREAPRVNGHCPSVDVLFASVSKTLGANAVGIILTGMGNDGALGLKAMRDAGARTLGQNEHTCVVYGMPKAAYELGAIEKQLSLERIGKEVIAETDLRKKRKEN